MRTRLRDTDRQNALPGWANPFLTVIWGAGAAQAQDDLITSHGYNFFGELRYAADFEHLDYVNPDAPQGGEMSFSWSSGGFDSIHPYTTQGRSAVLASIFFESMMTGTADDVGSTYCFLCETLEYPEDVEYVIFNLRDDVTFSDGTPMTAQDVLFSYEILRDEGLPSFRANIPLTIESAEVLDELPHPLHVQPRGTVARAHRGCRRTSRVSQRQATSPPASISKRPGWSRLWAPGLMSWARWRAVSASSTSATATIGAMACRSTPGATISIRDPHRILR